MNDLSVRRGASLPLTVKLSDTTALTADFIIKKNVLDTAAALIKHADFAEGIADITLSALDTKIDEGKYFYQLTVKYSDGTIDKFPESVCDDETAFPVITIEASLDD